MRLRPIGNLAGVLLLALGLSAAQTAMGADSIRVRDGWSRATPPGIEVGVAYLAIENHGKPDRLLGASSPIAKRVELHISAMKDGVMTMRHLDVVDIKPDAVTRFGPGGRHIMLIGLKHPLKKGDTFPLTLTFKNTGTVRISVHVHALTDAPPSQQ